MHHNQARVLAEAGRASEDGELFHGGRGRADRHTTLSEFQNPQNQSGIDKRVMIIFAVTMLLLMLASSFWSSRSRSRRRRTRRQGRPREIQARPRLRLRQHRGPRRRHPLHASSRERAGGQRADHGGGKRSLPHHFTNRGGQVKSWILKKYTDDQGSPWTWCTSRRRRCMASAFAVDRGRYAAGAAEQRALCRQRD